MLRAALTFNIKLPYAILKSLCSNTFQKSSWPKTPSNHSPLYPPLLCKLILPDSPDRLPDNKADHPKTPEQALRPDGPAATGVEVALELLVLELRLAVREERV